MIYAEIMVSWNPKSLGLFNSIYGFIAASFFVHPASYFIYILIPTTSAASGTYLIFCLQYYTIYFSYIFSPRKGSHTSID